MDKDKLILILGGVFVVIVGLVGMVVGLERENVRTEKAEEKQEQVVVEVPKKELAETESLRVLNASGKSGVAGKLAAKLKEQGLIAEVDNSEEEFEGNWVLVPEGYQISKIQEDALSKVGFDKYQKKVNVGVTIDLIIGR